jgi:D-alanyl-D-alanine carboxypeptidase (penicillin-binding protein 5/6)
MRLANRVVRVVLSFGLIAGTAGPVLADVPPPTPVPPFGSPSPFPTSLVTPPPSTAPPRLTAPSAVLEDLGTGQILFTKSPHQRRPIASITKVMTALIALERLDPSTVVTVGADAAGQTGARLGLRVGEHITARNLLYGLLLSSANDAAVALADAVGGSVPAFVRSMNRRAISMGLRRTRFASPTGLDDRGYSTSEDLAAIVRAAFRDPLFAAVVRTRFWSIPAPSGPARRIQNRNALLWLYPGAIGVKTGFTSRAGFCLIAAAVRNGLAVVVVVLGDKAEAFDDAAALLNYGVLEFQRVTVVRRGEALGTVDVGGRPVPAVATTDLTGLVRRDRVASVVRVLHARPGLALPISAGAIVGEETVEVDGLPIGTIPVAAGAAVAASPLPASGSAHGPFPAEVAGVVRLLIALLRALVGPFL